MENKRLSFGYEDTDKIIEIELYGLVFKIENIDSLIKDLKEIENLDKNDNNVIEAQIENFLGNGAIEKINNKRISDGYKKLDLNIELAILGCIMETCSKSMTGNFLGRISKSVSEINSDIEKVKNVKIENREQRRNYNRNQYRGNRRKYRRY